MAQQHLHGLDYHSTSFSQGRMDFTWQALTEEERLQAYADWEAGRGLIGGDPRRRPGSEQLPPWGLNRPFFRALAMQDARSRTPAQLEAAIETARELEIEIGFGRGDFLLDRSARHPERLFWGYEVKTKAVRLFLDRVERGQMTNLWVSDDDVRFNLPRLLPDGRVAIIHVLFPDPWWKDQHRVKRLFSPPFVDLLAAKLQSGGLLHFKSDVKEYGELVCYLLEQHPMFQPHDPALAARIGEFAPTHREFWCINRQRPIYTYYFARQE
ncbi:MAG: hypothetical protein KDE54_01330 [Caldilineaceae bacterium]|nr:hypothetical protein [Caldilineaceae bacterium]MCB0143117.1 hypothetical protein [Caldilineaceae bacterium]